MGVAGEPNDLFGEVEAHMDAPFVEHRAGDPRLISKTRRWLKANILEDEELHANEEALHKVGRSAFC